jgi:O-antigen ligase
VPILAYRSSNIRVAFAPVVASLVMALSILAFGAVPIVLLCGLLSIISLFCGRPLLLVLLWLAILLYEEIAHDMLFRWISLTQLGPILLLPMDIPYFLTIVYLSVGAIRRPEDAAKVLKDYPFLSIFLAIIIASTIIYTPQYGKMAIGEARKFYFFFFFPLMAVTSIKTPRGLNQLLLAILFVAVSISVFGYQQLVMGPSVVRSTLRVFSAGGALILLFTIFSVLIAHANGLAVVNRSTDNAMVGLFLPLIFMTHHRTVFLAATLGLVLLFALHRHKMLFVLKAIAASILLFTVIAGVFAGSPAFERMFLKALGGIAEPHSDQTASWRMEGWRQQLTALSRKELVFGKGLGSYYSWYNGTEKVISSPHNAYIQIILKFGLLGLLVYGMLVLSFIRKMRVVRSRLPPGPMRAYIEISLLNFTAAQAFMIGYDFSLIILIFYAMGITAVQIITKAREVVVHDLQGVSEDLRYCFD